MNPFRIHYRAGFRPILTLKGVGTLLLLAGLSGCSQSGPSTSAKRMRLAVGEIKEVSLPGRAGSSVVGTSDNQEVVDVTQKPFTPADSGAMQRGSVVPTVFLVKGVTIGTARIVFADKTTGEDGPGRMRQTYMVQVNSK